MKRTQAEEKIRAFGASAKPSVVKGLSFLVTNDPESGSSKNKKARSLGIPIIDEEGLLAILADPEKAGAVPDAPKMEAEVTQGAGEAKPKESSQPEMQGELF